MDEVRKWTLDSAVDDRGQLEFINTVSLEPVKRFYIVENHVPGFVRAWHGHAREGKFAMLLRGSALLIAAPLALFDAESPLGNEAAVDRVAMTWRPRTLIWIPPGYAHGFKLLTSDAQIMFFSTATLEESKQDDIRYPAKLMHNLWDVEER